MSQLRIAEALGIRQSAVSQRLNSAPGLDRVHPETLVEAATPVIRAIATDHGYQRRATGDDPSIAHGDHDVGIAGGLVQLVREGDHGGAVAPVELAAELQDLDLVREVEEALTGLNAFAEGAGWLNTPPCAGVLGGPTRHFRAEGDQAKRASAQDSPCWTPRGTA